MLFENQNYPLAPIANSMIICGLRPYYFSKNGHPKLSLWKSALPILHSSIFIGVVGFTDDYEIELTKLRTSKVVTVLEKVFFFILVSTLSVTYISCFTKWKQITEVLTNVKSLENQLILENHMQKKITHIKTCVYKHAFYYVLILIFLYSFVLEITLCVFIFGPENGYLFVLLRSFSNLIPFVIITNIQVLISVWFYQIRNYFFLINNLSKTIDYKHSSSFKKTIRKVVNMHKILTKLTNKMNVLYSKHLFLLMTLNYTLILSYLFVAIFMVLFAKTESMLHILYSTKIILQAVFNLSCLSTYAENLRTEVSTFTT